MAVKKRRRLRALAFTILVVAAVAVLMPMVPGSPGAVPAQAFCDGPNRPMWWSVGWAEETVRWYSTCDDLGDYYGKVRDSKTDGYCVRLYSKDDWEYAWTYRAQSCGTWTNYYYFYADRNAWWRVCKVLHGVDQVCTDPAAYNWGF